MLSIKVKTIPYISSFFSVFLMNITRFCEVVYLCDFCSQLIYFID